MRYRPELDGVRALAVLAVLASHTGIPIADGGWMGVDVFFVLSGYLITTLLLVEHDRSTSISLSRFYARRALRLYPLLVVILVVGACFYSVMTGGRSLAEYAKSALVSGLYLMDFSPLADVHVAPGLGHTWSLGVEEQFYLLWPPLLAWLITRRRDPLRWAIVLTLLSWAALVVTMDLSAPGNFDPAYFLPWNRFSQMLVGCALAITVRRWSAPRTVARPWFGWASGLACALLFLVGAFTDRYPHLSWEAPAIALATGALVWHLESDARRGIGRLLSAVPLAWLGRRSYGIYLLHLPILLLLLRYLHLRRSVIASLMIVTTVLLAAVSYRYLELPFLRLKRRFRGAQSEKVLSRREAT